MNLHSCVSIVESSLQTKRKKKSICENGVHTIKEKTFPSKKKSIFESEVHTAKETTPLQTKRKKNICESGIHKAKEKMIPLKKKVFVKVGPHG